MGSGPLSVLQLPQQHDTKTAEKPIGLAWAPDESALLLAGFESSSCAVFDVVESTIVTQARQSGDAAVTCVAWHPGNVHLAAAGLQRAAGADFTARIFSPGTGEPVSHLSGHGD